MISKIKKFPLSINYKFYLIQQQNMLISGLLKFINLHVHVKTLKLDYYYEKKLKEKKIIYRNRLY